MSNTESKNQNMKPLFIPTKPTLIQPYLGSFVQRFSLGIKEHDNTD